MKIKEYKNLWIIGGLLVLLALGGCAAKEADSSDPMSDTSEKSTKTTAVYYDFEDVLVPMELSVMHDRTIVVSTPGFRSGILALKGRVDSRALYNFFTHNMMKDNWSVVSRIKSPSTDILVFEKTSRVAVITIRSSKIYSYVEIGVAPRISDGTSISGSGPRTSSGSNSGSSSGFSQGTLTQ